jgi:hypothetical protein
MQVEIASSLRAWSPFPADTQFLAVPTAGWNADLQGLFTVFSIDKNLNGSTFSKF